MWSWLGFSLLAPIMHRAIVETLSNNPTFQRFAVNTNKLYREGTTTTPFCSCVRAGVILLNFWPAA